MFALTLVCRVETVSALKRGDFKILLEYLESLQNSGSHLPLHIYGVVCFQTVFPPLHIRIAVVLQGGAGPHGPLEWGCHWEGNLPAIQ